MLSTVLQKLLRRIDDPQLEEHDAEDLTVDEQKDLEDSYIALNDLLNKSKNVEEENQKLREEMNAQSLRNDRDKQEFMKYAISEFATDMVVVADNIRRAIETVSKEQLDASPVLNNLVEGFEVTERSLLSALKRHQVTRFDPLGEPFNPYLHEAKFTENTTDYPADTVVRVIHAGFMIGERLLRPAGVVVSQNSSDAQPAALRSTDNAKHANGANSGRYPQQANAYDRSASVLHKPIITGAQETSAPPYPTSSGQKATYGAADISHVSDLAKTIENMQSQIQAANDAFEDKNYKEAARLQENIAKAVSIAEAASEGGFGDSTLDALLSLTWYQLFAGQYEAVVATADQAAAIRKNYISIELNRAHALMLKGSTKEARSIYNKYKGAETRNKKPWEKEVLDDFAELAQANIEHPLMDEIRSDWDAEN